MKKLEALGERKIIEIIENRLDKMPRMPVPFGDDVSVFSIGNGRVAVLKTDMLVGKTDVPSGMSLWHAARKAVVMNVSDFAAKGVQPSAILVSLGLPKELAQKDVEKIAEGLNAGAREYGAYVIGGDTGEASELVISVSVFGLAKKGDILLRSGAQPDDVVAITGLFGKPPAGLRILLQGSTPRGRLEEALVESVLEPQARLKEGLALSSTKAVTASIDSSDGLAWSLHEIAKSSKVGFLIEKVPIAEEAKEFAKSMGLDPADLALYGGEEYELVLTVRPDLWQDAEKAVERVGGRLWAIGRVTSGRHLLLKVGTRKFAIAGRGYEHFT